MPAIFVSKLPIIRTKSPKRSDKNKTIKGDNKYKDISSIIKKIMLLAKINNKAYELKIYEEIITNSIYFKQWKDVIKKKI